LDLVSACVVHEDGGGCRGVGGQWIVDNLGDVVGASNGADDDSRAAQLLAEQALKRMPRSPWNFATAVL
jgi:hypothetical protein